MQPNYRETAKKLVYDNEALQNQMVQTERDTIDVISFLKKEDMKKDDQVTLIVYKQWALKKVIKISFMFAIGIASRNNFVT